jgi:iron complex outermembrane receptor protein
MFVKFKMRKNLTIVFCFVYFNLLAYNRISGKVTTNFGEAVFGASVLVMDLNIVVGTDSVGNYHLEGIPNGTIKLKFSSVGYVNIIKTVSINHSNMILDVSLSPTSLEVEEVVVTGGYNSTQHENAVKIDILKLDARSVGLSPNFCESLTRVPGVDMISKGAGVAKPVIRGLSMQDILVLNNGVRYENYQYSAHHPLGIDEFGLENVEVVKGPASLLYGSDAIGGVVNFIREKPAPVGKFQAVWNSQLYSNSLGTVNDLGVKMSGKKLFGGLHVGQKSHADYLEGGGNFLPNSRFADLSLKTDIGHTDSTGSYRFFYDYNQQKLGLPEEEAIDAIPTRGRELTMWYQQFDTHMASTHNKFYLHRGYRLDVNGAFQRTSLAHIAEPNVTEIEMALSTLSYESKLHLPAKGSDEFVVGIQGYAQDNKNLHQRTSLLLPDARIYNNALLGLFQRSFMERLKLQTGMRYDFKTISTVEVGIVNSEGYRPAISKSYSSVSGSLGATYRYTDDLILRANVATAYRTPNLAELTSNGVHELRYEMGDASLRPENSLEGDVSFHYHKDNLSVDWAGFYNSISNYIYLAPTDKYTPGGVHIYQYSQADSRLYGTELGAHFHPHELKWLHLVSTLAVVVGQQVNGNYLPFIPANKWRNEVRIELPTLGRISEPYVSAASQWAFNKYDVAPDETATRAYNLLDLNAGFNCLLWRQQVEWSFAVTNLLDTKYIDHLSTLKEVNRYNPGRNFILKLRIPIGG